MLNSNGGCVSARYPACSLELEQPRPSAGSDSGEAIIPYRLLSEDDSIASGVRRIACEQIERALASIEGMAADPAEAIHDLRKRCKKLRGLVRLVRPAFRQYEEENAAFRDIARLFAGLRDAEVMRAVLDKLVEQHRERIDQTTIRLARRRLGEIAAENDAAESSGPFDEARRRLSEARERVPGWRLDDDGWDVPRSGLLKTYARARKAMKKAAAEPGAERYHAWRKEVKYHWYHSRLLRAAWPGEMKRRSKLAFELSEVLGEHHDLFVLQRGLAEKPSTGSRRAGIDELARQHSAVLEETALRLGKRLLDDRPRDLGSRIFETRVFRS